MLACSQRPFDTPILGIKCLIHILLSDETEIGDPSPSDNTDELADLFDSTTYNAELNDEEHSEDPHGYGSGVNPITIPTRIPPRRCQLCCGRHWWRLRRRCPKVIRCKCGCGYRCRKRKGRKRNDQQNAADIKDQSADLSQV